MILHSHPATNSREATVVLTADAMQKDTLAVARANEY